MAAARRILLSVASLGAAASIAGLGTFATFTDSDTATNTIGSGTVDVNLGAPGVDNRLNVNATGLVPGDVLQRRVKLVNAGSQGLASVTLTTTATTSSLLDTDVTAGLQMKIEKCAGSLGWRESVAAPYTYTCDNASPGDNLGSRVSVLAQRPVVGAAMALANLSATTAGAADDMVVTVELPAAAGNTLQNQSSTIQYTFNATQRVATSK